jgi:hypothetical protein
MFRFPFNITIRRTSDGHWQPVMCNTSSGDIWDEAWYYANRSDAEDYARRWAENEDISYVSPEEVVA